jgi:transposase InsO family protein
VDLIDFRNEPDNIYHWILHIKDHFSKYCQLYALANKEAKTVASAMTFWLSAFGPPTIVQSDNGREFKGAFKELLLRYGIRIINGRPRTPRTQGLVEQANGTVKQKIIAWKRENGVPGWAMALPAVALQIN